MLSGLLLETSIFLSLFKKTHRNFCCTEDWLNEVYKNSQIYTIIKKSWATIKIYGRYSFLGRRTELKEEKGDITIVNNSVVVERLKNLSKKWWYNLVFYFKIGKSGNLVKQFKKDFYTLPLKTLSTIIIVAVLTNIIFLILFKKEIGLFDWIMRGLLLFTGISGLNSRVDWPNVKNSSIILRSVLKNVRNLRKNKF